MHRAIRISSVLLAITVILTCATFFVEASESPPVSDLLLSDDYFFERYELGYTVSASAQYATSMCDYEGNLDTWIAYG